MKIAIVALGHKLPDWQLAGYQDFASRIPRDWPVSLLELKPEKRSNGRSSEQVLQAEAERINQAIPTGYRRLVLDERGAAWTTRQLADKLQAWQHDAQNLCFVIGSADGLAPSIKASADQLLQLSALTLPHGLVRVLLIEQIYRAIALLNNHPYHRE
jgi:23S rRNA (pseudouridine1915-N3)-methyltransferase